MTIKEFILDSRIKGKTARLKRLEEIAPKVVVEREKELIQELKDGKLNISGDVDVLDEELDTTSIETITGRGGKVYLVFNNHINFFPEAKYGMYIKRQEV